MRYNGGLAFLSRQAPPVEENKYYTTLTLNIHRSMLDVYNSLINITCLTQSCDGQHKVINKLSVHLPAKNQFMN